MQTMSTLVIIKMTFKSMQQEQTILHKFPYCVLNVSVSYTGTFTLIIAYAITF